MESVAGVKWRQTFGEPELGQESARECEEKYRELSRPERETGTLWNKCRLKLRRTEVLAGAAFK